MFDFNKESGREVRAGVTGTQTGGREKEGGGQGGMEEEGATWNELITPATIC